MVKPVVSWHLYDNLVLVVYRNGVEAARVEMTPDQALLLCSQLGDKTRRFLIGNDSRDGADPGWA